MRPVKPEASPYLELRRSVAAAGEPASLREFRDRAAARFGEIGFPTRRDEAWRFLACLALDGPLVVLARSQQVVPWEPEFERVELLDGAIYLRLRNAPRGSS